MTGSARLAESALAVMNTRIALPLQDQNRENKGKGPPHSLFAAVASVRIWRGSRCAVGGPTREATRRVPTHPRSIAQGVRAVTGFRYRLVLPCFGGVVRFVGVSKRTGATSHSSAEFLRAFGGRGGSAAAPGVAPTPRGSDCAGWGRLDGSREVARATENPAALFVR